MRFTLALATLALSTVAFAQILNPVSDIFQIHYASNLNVGDSFVDIVNTGAATALGVADPAPSANICVNLYTFDPAEELISCCSCVVTPNGLQSLSVLKSLISNPLTPAIPTSVVIKAVSTLYSTSTAGTTCDRGDGRNAAAHGMLAWATTLHQNTSTAAASYSVTESPFSEAALSFEEYIHITSTCAFIEANGSGFGICKGCAAGGLGAAPSNQ